MSDTLTVRGLPWKAFVFGQDGANHAVVTIANNLSRKKRHRFVCGLRTRRDAQRRSQKAIVTCDKCLRSVTGMLDLLDEGDTRG